MNLESSNQFEQADESGDVAVTGIVATAAAMIMLFAALISAYIVRRGISDDWSTLRLPGVAYFSALPAIVTSAVIEIARKRGNRLLLWWALALAVTLALMLIDLWRQLGDASSSTAFFLVISGLFFLFVIGAIVGLLGEARKERLTIPSAAVTYYWHGLATLWILLLAFFSIWR
jgi:heme/copper-type cytochrome/quinol oxidase subunit 3